MCLTFFNLTLCLQCPAFAMGYGPFCVDIHGFYRKTKIMDKRYYAFGAAAVISVAVFLGGCSGNVRETEESASLPSVEEQADSCLLYGFDPGRMEVREGKVHSGEFFSSLLMKSGMSAADAYLLSEACDTVFDVRTLRVGNIYQAYYSISSQSSPDGDGAQGSAEEVASAASGAKSGAAGSGPDGDASGGDVLEYLVYWQDRVNGVVFKCTAPYSAWKVARPVVTERRYADVTISSSLWNDMLAAGVSPLLILSLSDIYAWTVDFFGLQKGDRFRVFYDEKTCEGDVIAVDTVRYAVFTHQGEDFPAVMFDQGDGGNIYWNEKGESMRKAFLKAPLQYSRISSGFSYARRHPVTRRVQPHTGVDYAAPAGTPVMTIGDGVVTSRRNEGAGGNVVRIRHNSVYSTAYLHLSRYASGLKVGQRVRQGEVIGYVGSTGRSTGPHLDFRVWKNGSPINPLKMESPPAEPLKAEFSEDFEAVCLAYSRRLDSLEALPVARHLLKVL